MGLEQTALKLSSSTGETIKDLMLEQARQTFGNNFPILKVALPDNEGVNHYRKTTEKPGLIIIERKCKGPYGGNQYIILTPEGLIEVNRSRYNSMAENELPSWEDCVMRNLTLPEYHKYIRYAFAALKGDRELVHLG